MQKWVEFLIAGILQYYKSINLRDKAGSSYPIIFNKKREQSFCDLPFLLQKL